MSLLPGDFKLQTFRCPMCGRYINDEMSECKHCSAPIAEDMKARAIMQEQAERKKIFLGRDKQQMLTGLVIIAAALGNLITGTFEFHLTYSSGMRIPCISPIALIVGVAIALDGLRRFLSEKSN